MRAVKIMVFLLLVNISVTMVGALNIYNIDDLDEKSDIEGSYNASELGEASGENAIWFFLGQSAITLMSGAILGAVAGSYLLKIPTSLGAAYGFFASLITLVFLQSYSILWQIVNFMPEGAKFGAQLIVGLFLGVCGLMFALGFLQLVAGGIKSYY